MDKPRGFAVIGRAEACDFLADKPVGMLWGVGRSLAGKLRRNGITKIGQLQQIEEQELVAKYGVIGSRLYHFARGNDTRKVEPNSQTKSISAETTFESDISDATALLERTVPLCRTVARRLENKDLAGQGVTVKLKQSDFRLLTRSCRLANPTQQAEAIYRAAKWLIEREADGRTFRLIGVGVDDLTDASDADPPDPLCRNGYGTGDLISCASAVRFLERIDPRQFPLNRIPPVIQNHVWCDTIVLQLNRHLEFRFGSFRVGVEESQIKGANFIRAERRFERFIRRFGLPGGKINAVTGPGSSRSDPSKTS